MNPVPATAAQPVRYTHTDFRFVSLALLSSERSGVQILSRIYVVEVPRVKQRQFHSLFFLLHCSVNILLFNSSMVSELLTVSTTSFTFSNSTFCPHSIFMCFVWIWEQTAIISLQNINWLVCMFKTKRVYSAVRTQYLYINWCETWNFSLPAPYVDSAQTASRRPVTALYRYQSQARPFEIYSEESGTRTGFSRCISASLQSV